LAEVFRDDRFESSFGAVLSPYMPGGTICSTQPRFVTGTAANVVSAKGRTTPSGTPLPTGMRLRAHSSARRRTTALGSGCHWLLKMIGNWKESVVTPQADRFLSKTHVTLWLS
jgi:hypothetical protein